MGMEHASVARVSSRMVAALAESCHAGGMREPLDVPFGATAQRPDWADLPPSVRSRIVAALGSAVVSADSQRSGFTPGFASRLRLADGRTVFAKAADSGHPWLVNAYALEAKNLALLPASVPAPRVRARLDITGPDANWLVLILDDVPGRPPARPWQTEEAARVLTAVESLSRALTPAPPGHQWSRFVDAIFPDPTVSFDLLATRGSLPDILEPMRALGFAAIENARGDTLVHSDLRDDNIILDKGDRVWICDWNMPTSGPIWVDTLTVLISMVGDGLDGERLIGESNLFTDVDPDLVDGLLALLVGYFLTAELDPLPDASPYLRAAQGWYAHVVEEWLRRRRHWGHAR